MSRPMRPFDERVAPGAWPGDALRDGPPVPPSYLERREQIETYFDRTAAQTWARLTSDAPVGRIRATVRAGRDAMRNTLLSWLPTDLRGQRVFDAGCGTGAFAVAAARRGAAVIAVDLSPTLVDLARERLPADVLPGSGPGRIDFRAGDMLDPEFGSFDYVVGMDSLIHYRPADAVRVLEALTPRTRRALLFTFAPSNPALAAMHAVGQWFPRANRSPSIVPVAEKSLHRLLAGSHQLGHWQRARTQRIASGFYTSQALELVAP